MVGYADSHKGDTYKWRNPETKMVIMTRDIKWAEWKMTDPAETMNMFQNFHE